MSAIQLHYHNLIYERRIHPRRPLKVELRQPTGFRCAGPRCTHKPIHSSQYYNPLKQPNQPLIGIRCPLDKHQGAFRTYKRTEYIQDIRTLNNLQTGPIPILSDATVPSSPSGHLAKSQGHHLTKPMTEPKRMRLPCPGIPGVRAHEGKSKPGNRKCSWQVCPDCCRPQRDATGTQCYTHESAERAKVAVPPNTQPFLETVLESAANTTGATQTANVPEIADGQSLVLGPAPPLHPLKLSPSTMRLYHLNRSREAEAKRAEEAADASCDKNISISLWLTADSDPIPFLFASKTMKQFSISECEPMILFIKDTLPHWNQCLRVYDVRSERWNITSVGTSIPMLTPLREALVCMTSAEPKLLQGLAPLQARLAPSRTTIKSTLDLLRATPQHGSRSASTSISGRSSSMSSGSSQQSPSPTPDSTANQFKGKGKGRSAPKTPPKSSQHHALSSDDEAGQQAIERGPKFHHNIFNNEDNHTPTEPKELFFSSTIIDLTDQVDMSPNRQPHNPVLKSANPNPQDRHNIKAGKTTVASASSTAISRSTAAQSPPPNDPDSDKKAKTKRRTHKTGLWPPPDMPMQVLIEWHIKHLTSSKDPQDKKKAWNCFFAPAHKFNRTAMYRYIRWITKVTVERWDEWFAQCNRDLVKPTFAAAKDSFGCELRAVW